MEEKKYVVFFDIDGTIYDHFLGVPEGVMETLHRLKEEGYLLCLNTGRARKFIPGAVLGFPFDGIVAGSGTFVEYEGRVLQDINFARPFVKLVNDEFLKNGIPFTMESEDNSYMTAFMAEHTKKRFNSRNKDMEHSQAVRLTENQYEMKDNMDGFSFDMPVHKISFYALEDRLAYITGLIGNCCVISLEQKDGFGYIYGEAIPAGCCKSNGAALLCSFAGVPYDHVIAVGDGSNDIDLIRWAQIGIVMGNADESLKEFADYVCSPLDEGGISGIPEYITRRREAEREAIT